MCVGVLTVDRRGAYFPPAAAFPPQDDTIILHGGGEKRDIQVPLQLVPDLLAARGLAADLPRPDLPTGWLVESCGPLPRSPAYFS